MAAQKYINDYSLIDGNKIVRGHKTEIVLKTFAVRQLQKIKFILMHIALTEEQADTLLDCIIDDHFAVNGDMKEFEDKLESIGHFLDYYLDRLPYIIQTTDEKDVPEEDNPNEKKYPLFDGDDWLF